VPGSPKNRTCSFHRIRLKQASEGPLAATPYDPLARTSVPSAGPFTSALTAASNLSVGSGVVVIFFSQAHLPASAPLRVRAEKPVSGQLCETISGGADLHVPVSCCLSATDIRFSVIRVPPRGWASLAVGLPVTRTPTGLPRSARTSCDRVGCPLYPEDDGAHPGLRELFSRRLPLPSGQTLHPAPTSHLRGSP
jgi:hypothetical protein